MMDDPRHLERWLDVRADIAKAVNDAAERKGIASGAALARRARMDRRRARRILNGDFCTLRTLVPILDVLGLELVVQRKSG